MSQRICDVMYGDRRVRFYFNFAGACVARNRDSLLQNVLIYRASCIAYELSFSLR